MKDKMKSAATKVKSHFERHAFGYAMLGVTAVVGAVFIERVRAEQVKEFLTSKGLDVNEFLMPEEFEENNDQEGGA